jgi:hypothetical protein
MAINVLPFVSGLIAALVFFPSIRCLAQSNTRAIIHIPTKSLTSMPLFFGKDKGFFTSESVDVDLVLMSPPTATVMAVYSKDGTKPREVVQKEIDIYREALKISKPFTPEELEDMSHQRRAYELLNR